MKLARIKLNDKIYYTKYDNNLYYPLDNDFFNYNHISSKPLSGVVKVLPPVYPEKIIALGLNYNLHIKELYNNDNIPKEPVIFLKPNSSIVGHMDTILIPKRSSRVDFEAELAFVIAKDCKNIDEDNAKDYILGYTCLNDVTARDLQKIDGQWTRAKGYDTFCPIGPYIVTDINPSNLNIKAILNGEVKQSSNTSDMIFTIPKILSYVSHIMTMKQGDIITTGTPNGIAPLSNGDKIEIYIEKVGTLINNVKSEK